jgi:hypothetical protein
MAAVLGPRARRLAFVLLLVVFAGIRGAAAQSLADVAKKEEARRKAVPAPAKVYTNKDLTAPPAGSLPPPEVAATPDKPADAAKEAADKAAKDKEAKDKEPAKDQAYWAARLKALRDKLDRDMTFADALQTKVNSLTADFVNRDDPAQRAQVERDRQKAVADLARLHQDVAGGKKAIADLQEEARQAGVPPGWLR